MAEAVRDAKGRFVKGGESISPGRPRRVIEVAFHDILVESVTEDVWRGIVRRAMVDALKGDKFAREWISNYVIGKPPQILELRAADAALLADLLKRFEAVGVSASAVFNAMLAELVEQESETVTDDER